MDYTDDACMDEFQKRNVSLSLSGNGATIAVGFQGEVAICGSVNLRDVGSSVDRSHSDHSAFRVDCY